MAATGNLTVTGNVSGQPTGQRTFGPMVVVASAAVDATNVIALGVGANTITIPAGATSMVITGPNAVYPVPNPPYAGTLTIKGVAGDTGIPISAKWPTVLEWDTVVGPPATIVINATVVCTIECWYM